MHAPSSVVDADPDPYAFGHPWSWSVIICTDPDTSINKQKKWEKPAFLLFFLNTILDFLSSKTDVNVPPKSITQKSMRKTYKQSIPFTKIPQKYRYSDHFRPIVFLS